MFARNPTKQSNHAVVLCECDAKCIHMGASIKYVTLKLGITDPDELWEMQKG